VNKRVWSPRTYYKVYVNLNFKADVFRRAYVYIAAVSIREATGPAVIATVCIIITRPATTSANCMPASSERLHVTT